MKSCLYEGRVMHARLSPIKNRFVYPLFMFYLDLSEVEEAARRLRWFSHNRFNLFSFWDRDHGDEAPIALREKIRTFLEARGVGQRVRHIRLLTHMRTLGHVFNPVSFYFCFDEFESAVCALAEVENTYHEKKMYYLAPEQLSDGRFRLRVPKHFYVSPFIDLEASFDFNLAGPDECLEAFVDDYQNDERILVTALVAKKHLLTDARLLWFTFRFPFMTLQVLGLIHWQAFKFWWRGLPHLRKTDRPDLQRGAYHVKSHS